eukprot:6212483-Pleurochrysis_carterae.AAC.8
MLPSAWYWQAPPSAPTQRIHLEFAPSRARPSVLVRFGAGMCAMLAHAAFVCKAVRLARVRHR